MLTLFSLERMQSQVLWLGGRNFRRYNGVVNVTSHNSLAWVVLVGKILIFHLKINLNIFHRGYTYNNLMAS